MKYLTVLPIALMSLQLQANVYQCELNGKVTFSQFPCEEKSTLTQEVSSGNVILTTSKKPDQQMETLRKKSRYLEYQLAQLEQQQKQQLQKYENDIYQAKHRGEKSNFVTMMNQKLQKMQREFQLAKQQREKEIAGIQQQITGLQRQYAAQ
jgi:predicted RNase H-like nuclease (RuvC/YqgF family)